MLVFSLLLVLRRYWTKQTIEHRPDLFEEYPADRWNKEYRQDCEGDVSSGERTNKTKAHGKKEKNTTGATHYGFDQIEEPSA